MLRLAAVLAILLAVAGCDSGPSATPQLAGSARIDVTGTPAFQIDGGAVFGLSRVGPDTLMSVIMRDRAVPRQAVSLTIPLDGSRLTRGEHAIGLDPDEEERQVVVLATNDGETVIYGLDGTLTITNATGALVEGTIDARLVVLPAAPTGEPVEEPTGALTGQFSAEAVN